MKRIKTLADKNAANLRLIALTDALTGFVKKNGMIVKNERKHFKTSLAAVFKTYETGETIAHLPQNISKTCKERAFILYASSIAIKRLLHPHFFIIHNK